MITKLNKLVDYETYKNYEQIFLDTFDYDILTFCNPIILNMTTEIKLDIIKFDDFFKMDSSYHNMSLKEYIKGKYGDKVLTVVEYFL